MTKQEKAFIDRFSDKALKVSDFKFKWAIRRSQTSTDWRNVWKTARESGLAEKIDNGSLDAAGDLGMLIAKNSSPNYIYRLVREFIYADALTNFMVDLTLNNNKEKLKQLKADGANWSVYKEALKLEKSKERTFSSLSSMQKWVDKNGFKLDVHKLWAKMPHKTTTHIEATA